MNKTSSQVQLSWDFEKSFDNPSLLGYGSACRAILAWNLGAGEAVFQVDTAMLNQHYSLWGLKRFDVFSPQEGAPLLFVVQESGTTDLRGGEAGNSAPHTYF